MSVLHDLTAAVARAERWAAEPETQEFLDETASRIKDIVADLPAFPFPWPPAQRSDVILMGCWLCSTKEGLKHGEFIRWVEKECPFSYRTAHRYMRIAEGWNRLTELRTKTDTVADLPLEEHTP